MKANLFIKYKGLGIDDSEIDLVTLGESIIGFDLVIREIFKTTKIDADIKVGVSKTREGSLIVDIIIFVISNKEHVPFEKISDLLNFLEIVSPQQFLEAKNFFGFTSDLLVNGHRNINDYFARNPFDQEVLSNMVTGFVAYFFGKAQGQKRYPDLDELKKDYAIAAHKMIKNHKFKKALKPFVDEKVKSISVSNYPDFKNESLVDENNFDNYLSDEEKILPNYEDGKKYLFTGKIVAMQCSKGDSLKLQVHGFSRRDRDLIAYPPEGKTTKDLDDFYEEDVAVEAIVERKSLYQKPKLRIVEIKQYQQPLM
ncbi:MAG: hypothetical protein WAV73_01445 [Candidatus Moraniibacteriota bacterium]